SYLNIDRILEAARTSRADAIHPGYGFLSENWRFAEACRRAGLIFVGPSPDAIRQMGDKTEARRLMAAAGIAVLPGSHETVADAGARAVGYVNAGTLEFLVDAAGDFYFLEMNTRLQVEHPVTEEATGLDLVVAQLRVAQGERLPWRQEEIAQRRAAIECRVYAEDPA